MILHDKKKSKKYYLLPNEEEPMRTCKNKTFICKVTFLAALARPIDVEGNELFDGNIGVLLFVTQKPTNRYSADRVASIGKTKTIISVNKEVPRSYLIEKVLHAIKAKFDILNTRNVFNEMPIMLYNSNLIK